LLSEETELTGSKDIYAGIPDLSNISVRQIAKLNIFAAIVIGLNAIGWGTFWIFQGSLAASFACFAYLPLAYWIHLETKAGRYYRGFSIVIVGLVFWLSLIAIVASGPGCEFGPDGEYRGSVHSFFLTIAVAVFLVLKGGNKLMRFSLTFSLVLFFLGFHIPIVNFVPLITMDPTQHFIAGVVTWTSATCTSIGLWVWLSKTPPIHERKIKFTNKQLHHLFSEVHLKDVSKSFKPEHGVIARAIPDCSVLFVEVANLAELNQDLEEPELLRILNRLYGEFDDAIYALDLDKVKTYELTYMVASGVSQYDHMHANDLVSLGLSFVEIAKAYEGLHLRIGVHSGAATAGLTKESDFVYALWGESVNLALLLGNLGNAGLICISEPTYRKVQNLFECEYSQQLNNRDYGQIKMYHVIKQKAGELL
jgi:class 3 adenylate cyclase